MLHPWSADLTETASLRDPPARFERVIFSATAGERSEERYRQVYVEGLRNLMRALRNATSQPAQLCFISSTSVYGQNQGEWVDETSATEPTGFSGKIMLEAEALAAELCEDALSIRLSGIYGPGRTRLLQRIAKGEALETGRITNRIHIEDCVGVVLYLMSLNKHAPLYLASDDEPCSIGEVATWIAAQLGKPAPRLERKATKGKRCRNTQLKSTGYRFMYPGFRKGYAELLEDMR